MSPAPIPLKRGAVHRSGGDFSPYFCVRCNSQQHTTEDCPVTHQPTLGGTGNCIRCGSAGIDVLDDMDFWDSSEDGDLYECPNCGLIANATD